MRERLQAALDAAVSALLEDAGDPAPAPGFALDPPRQAEHGDFATNAALVLAKRLKQPPRTVAEALVAKVGAASGLVARAEVAGPGFVNFWLERSGWRSALQDILAAGSDYGRSDAGKARKVMVEFISANPTGPLSVGHGRQAVLGDCIARLFDATGWRVTREYYFNNGGRQMRVLGESVRARYLELLGRAAAPPEDALKDETLPWPAEIGGKPVVFPREGYQGSYIADIAQAVIDREGEGWLAEPGERGFRMEAEQRIFAEIRATQDALGITFDVYTNELTMYEEKRVEGALADLRKTTRVFEEGGAVWLRATDLGLARDRVLVKSSGEPTYLLPDVAYHRQKLERGFERIVDVQGADHKDQGPYVKAALAALGLPAERVEFVIHEFVTLTAGGQTVKQSTRRATFITVDEVLKDVGADVFRFFMIQRRPESHLDFDLDLAKETDWTKNPAYYLQYAHARCCGIERQAAERGVTLPKAGEIDAERLALPEEIELIRKLAEFPDVVARAAEACEPHHVAYYTRDVAALWNPYLQDGKNHRVLSDDAELTAARLGLVAAVRTVIANGLRLLGMSAPERM
ncbi:MAG: arginine--tRNA ligase [Deltaproteobacteria bacterium]|nr:arginine--tRNA ligase [Deltaproteobacteria bacterium]